MDDNVKKLEQDYEIEYPELEREYEIEKYIKLLPAWFTSRMLDDSWHFGLLMITGDIIAIQYINSIKQDANGNIWLDATLQDCQVDEEVQSHKVFVAPTSRTNVSINSSHVMAAFELTDS
ncbi:MAG: hypothetical protein QNJ38_14460 [Prochloraceae cyanobacterium]|nr:hypothetical protein [Prochloraceae cyanobacterium]